MSVMVASWPIETEMQNKVGGSQGGEKKAMLLASVHLVCRPRATDAPVGDWVDVLRELRIRVSDWMNRLQGEGIRGADLVFACIGPALEIFSRYSRVETVEGRKIDLPDYLEKVWEVVGRTALSQIIGTNLEGGLEELEEDARLTALFLWTLQSTESRIPVIGESSKAAVAAESRTTLPEDQEEEEDEDGKSKKPGPRLIYDVVRRISQPLGLHLDNLDGRIIDIEKGAVRLIPVTERAKQLFGERGAEKFAQELGKTSAQGVQLKLLADYSNVELTTKKMIREERTEETGQGKNPTTLDIVHTAMLLQASGQAAALRELVASEVARNLRFLRLANALSALYPKESEEKRLIDAVLLITPRR
jgi:putative DNA methylase